MNFLDVRVIVPASQANELKSVVQSLVDDIVGERDEPIEWVDVHRELDGGSVVIRAVGVPRHGTSHRRSGTLTPRQLEILRLLANGNTTAQIAIELNVSKTTVRNHIANLMACLGAHTRLQALVVASRAGLISVG